MTSPVFKAAFADFKLVKTRSCAQLIFELPIEQADAALQTLGGLPRAATEVWAAIARIAPAKPASEPRNAPDKASAPRERKPFKSLPLAQQAAMRCNEPEFERFLVEKYDAVGGDSAEVVRELCKVASRSEIQEGQRSGDIWHTVELEYLDWRHSVPSYEGIAR